jgi:hypothetical protein
MVEIEIEIEKQEVRGMRQKTGNKVISILNVYSELFSNC